EDIGKRAILCGIVGVRASPSDGRHDARITEDDEMALVVGGVFIGTDKDDATGHGGRAVTCVAIHDIRDIRDPADAVSFSRGASIERMQFVVTPRYMAGEHDSLTPRPHYEHVVPRRAGPPVIVVPVHRIEERWS